MTTAERPKLLPEYLQAHRPILSGMYVTGEEELTEPQIVRLSDQAYLEMTQALARASGDVIPYCKVWERSETGFRRTLKSVGINRKRKPMEGGWFAGGRRLARESWIMTILRYCKDDLLLGHFLSDGEIMAKVSCLHGPFGGPWDFRWREKRNDGSIVDIHDTTNIAILELEEDFLQQVVAYCNANTQGKEYSSVWLRSVDEIIADDKHYHIALRDVMAALNQQVLQ